MIFKSPHKPVEIPDVSLSELILERSRNFGPQTAFIDGTSGRRVTFSGFVDAVTSVARGLSEHGFKKREVFAIYAPNSIDYAIAFHAVSLLGGTITTVNPLYTSEELAVQLRDSNARFLLTTQALMEKALEARSQVHEIFVIDGFDGIPFLSLHKNGGPLPEVVIHPAEDVVAMPYSSGTTGLPKGVMLTHRNLVANLIQIQAAGIVQPDDVVLCVLPMFHIYGLVVIMNECLYVGATVVILPRFNLELVLQMVQEHRITLAPVVPPIMLGLARQPVVDHFDLSSLRTVFSAAAPLGEELSEACRARLNCIVKQGYGMTEASPATHMCQDDPAFIKKGSVGVLVPNTECKILDASGRELDPMEHGEILVRGPQVMKGYLNREDATSETIDPEGWLRTGDIGYADHEGHFFIVDRLKELIKYKGFQVAPAELEAVLLTHPMVADAAVIPSPDEEAGEVPKAFVVLKGEVALEEIQGYVAERLSPHKRIRKIERIDQIPKSPSGKTLRRLLVQKERST